MLKGVTAHPGWTSDPTCAWWAPWADALRGTGLDFVRFDINWQDTAAIAKTQAICRMLSAMTPFVSLGSSGSSWQRPDPEDYAAVAADIARVLPAGGVLEIWNEPNVVPKFWPGPAEPGLYGLLCNGAYQAIKSQAPHVTVAAGCFLAADAAFLSGFMETGGHAFDWLAVHPYTKGLNAPPDDPDAAGAGRMSFCNALTVCRQALDNVGRRGHPIAITEVGWPVDPAGSSHYRAALQLARSANVVAFGAYGLGDHPSGRDAYSLFNEDRSPRLAMSAFLSA